MLEGRRWARESPACTAQSAPLPSFPNALPQWHSQRWTAVSIQANNAKQYKQCPKQCSWQRYTIFTFIVTLYTILWRLTQLSTIFKTMQTDGNNAQNGNNEHNALNNSNNAHKHRQCFITMNINTSNVTQWKQYHINNANRWQQCS